MKNVIIMDHWKAEKGLPVAKEEDIWDRKGRETEQFVESLLKKSRETNPPDENIARLFALLCVLKHHNKHNNNNNNNDNLE